MKTLYVGGHHFFNQFSNLEAAIERTEHDDVIELEKDINDVSVTVTKNITINGNGHIITPANGKAAFDCTSFVIFNNIRFDCKSRTNAIVIRNGGKLNNITTNITGAIKSLYPTIVQRSGTLTIEDSKIMFIETYESHGTNPKTKTFFKKSVLNDYYDGFAYLDNDDYNLSKFYGTTNISESDITCAFLKGNCTLSDTILRNFNKAVGTVRMASCELKSTKGKIQRQSNDTVNGPLKDWRPNVIPYALHIAGGKVITEKHSSNMSSGCIGFYMTGGELKIQSTETHNKHARHLIKDGIITFDNVIDDGFYKIKKAHCSIIRSKVNSSMKTKSAMEELNAMIGLSEVKKQLRTIVNTINVNMNYPEKDFGFSHHMIFAGDPGTGKTTIAKLVARALFEIGAIPENKCLEVPASQLVKGFVGQTGEHVESIMKKALGGVLFIDEAYELTIKDGQNTFNNDVLSVLIRYMEDHRNDLIVIAAGYEKEMKEFIASNVGLTRRFQWVTFEDYTPNEMANIFQSMMTKFKEVFTFEDSHILLTECFEQLTDYYLSHPDSKGRITNGGNGGLVRNVFQQVIFARNNRVMDDSYSTMKITHADVIAGFQEEHEKAMKIS